MHHRVRDMKQMLSLPFQYKAILAFLLLMNLSFFVTGYIIRTLAENTILREKETKLLILTTILDGAIGPGGYAAIIARHGAETAGRDEKIGILNKELAPVTDQVAKASPGLGAGFYSRELDAIITYGPSSQFGHAVGVPIPPEHPGRTVMAENIPLVRSGTMVRGDIMNAMNPIVRNGEVIGYIWANELSTDIMEQFSRLNRNLSMGLALCFIITVIFLALLSRRTVSDINRTIRGVREMRFDLSKRITGVGGDLREVAESVNAMAEGISKATEETNRAVSILQSVMSNVDAVVCVCDPKTKRIVYVNDALAALWNRDDLAGAVCHEALYGKTVPCGDCPCSRLFDADGNPLGIAVHSEERLEDKDRDFFFTDRLVTWHDGRLLHMRVGTDVTERRALAAAEAANQAQRDFLARMSHEIRTPMNGVLGMTRLAMQADPPPAQMEYLKKIHSSAALLLGIINDILDFSRIEAGKLTIEKAVFDPRAMVETIQEIIMPRIDENKLEFIVAVDDSVPEKIVGDKLRLSQVLLNLLGNAAKFTLRGKVSLSMRAEPSPSGGLRLHCAVADTGIGMDEEQQKRLFTPFSQADSSTSRKFGGTGLGLSICKALVHLMHGDITGTSSPGKGSLFTFFVEMEAAAAPDQNISETKQPWHNTRYDGRSFLLVEDNLINQEIALAVLRDMGAAVDVAANGEEGVRAFMAKDYDLVLMDVRMPVMDGLAATTAIRCSTKWDAKTVPIIAMTANAMVEDREASREAGMNGHVAKPLDIEDLQKTLYSILPQKE